MNTSQHSSLLSAEQLEGFLQNKLAPEEMKRVQHLLDDCELSREALEGYTLMPGAFADVEALKKSIAKKSGMSVSWGTISLGIVLIAVASVVLTMFLNDDQVVQPIAATPEQETPVTLPKPINMLSPKQDHFVNPEAKVVEVNIPGHETSTGDSVANVVQLDFVIEPIPVDEKKQLIVDSVPVVPKKAEITYNAQVGYIVDLKVTEFDKYYNSAIEVKELPLTGTPAKFETQDDFSDSPDEKTEETVRMIPADQFLREGLIAFRDGRYGKCIGKMEVLLDHNPEDINALFYSAVSYFKLEMYNKAIPLLDKIILSENNVFDEEAEWYKALALEGNGDSGAALLLFKSISDQGGFYSKQAAGKLR